MARTSIRLGIVLRVGAFLRVGSGRALGLQNTGQFLVAACVPPVAGLVATHAGYAVVFGLAAVFAAVALPLVPVRDERDLS